VRPGSGRPELPDRAGIVRLRILQCRQRRDDEKNTGHQEGPDPWNDCKRQQKGCPTSAHRSDQRADYTGR
jgi:hypothetical protein